MVTATLMVMKEMALGDRFSPSTLVFPASSHSTICSTFVYDHIFRCYYSDSVVK
jgi:hypothetical protein